MSDWLSVITSVSWMVAAAAVLYTQHRNGKTIRLLLDTMVHQGEHLALLYKVNRLVIQGQHNAAYYLVRNFTQAMREKDFD